MWASILLFVALGAGQDPDHGPGPAPEVVEATVAELRVAFRDGAKEDKVHALERAGDVVAPAVIAEVGRGFRDEEREVQAATIQALRWMDHPDALDALQKNARGNRKLQKDEELYPALLKAVGQHADPDSIRVLADKPFDSPFHQATRARILGLGRIRTRASLEALLDIMKSASEKKVAPHMPSFRLSLMILTGTDQGPTSAQWLRWWSANKKDYEVSPERRELPRSIQRSWTEYWGIDDDYGRTGRREDRGEK